MFASELHDNYDLGPSKLCFAVDAGFAASVFSSDVLSYSLNCSSVEVEHLCMLLRCVKCFRWGLDSTFGAVALVFRPPLIHRELQVPTVHHPHLLDPPSK